MTTPEERKALWEKVEEVHRATVEMEDRLARLPFTRESEGLREMMVNMLGKLHHVEQEVRAMLSSAGENDNESEGGTDNGSRS